MRLKQSQWQGFAAILFCLLLSSRAKVPLFCEGGLEDLPDTFFEDFDMWQSRYSRDSIKMSRDFLYSVFQPRIEPWLEESFAKCPAPVLEIMMNGILAMDTDGSTAEATEMFLKTVDMAERVAGSSPEIAALLEQWVDDVATVYPHLFGLQPHSCHGASLKIFVYDVPENLTSPMLFCHHGQWGTEVLFHRFFLHGACRTDDPSEADFFYVPVYGTCLHVLKELAQEDRGAVMVWDILMDFLRKQDSFLRRGKLDHIFLFADGQGPRLWDSYDLIQSDAIFLQVESKCPTWDEPSRRYSDVKSCYSAWKDIIIPGHVDHARKRYMMAHNRPTEERDLLLTFHGRHGGVHDAYNICTVRGKVMDLDGQPGADVGGFVFDYLERKGRSHFCLVPGGTSPWTNHLYESFFSGCIPVILSDEYEPAFQEIVPWHDVSIKWPEAAVDRLYDYLSSISVEARRFMKDGVDRNACWFDYFSNDPQCSPYLAVLRGLAERKSRFPAHHGRFWNADVAFEGLNGTWPPSRATRFHVLTNESFRLDV